MHKNSLFLKKTGKSPQRWGLHPPNPRWLEPPDPRVVTPITCYSYFLEGAFSANVISYCQKGLKELKNSKNVLF